ncbi:MAG: hypothetical protein KGR26_15140, partial [Cyanobacteria bacterium REEB65]|nr:hypothetical protein [Cyanobacteria bacterium REEB65]
LYVCFVELALEWLEPGGEFGMILPNKFLVNRYARSLRQRMLAFLPPRTLRDASERPAFRNVGVYPITVHARKLHDEEPTPECLAIGPAGGKVTIGLETFAATGNSCTWFIPEDPVLGTLLARLLAGTVPRLGAQLQFRTTVSFHAVGLRERYIRRTLAQEPGVRAYLGGQSWSRQKAIAPFVVTWDGFSIRYAAQELAAQGNPLPPLSQFDAPKIIFCQHARRLAAHWDPDGSFVTKDVYPIALAAPDSSSPSRQTAAYCALFNSRVLTVLYAVLFRGICIGGGYYHYLPAFLAQLPCPSLTPATEEALAAMTEACQASPSDRSLTGRLDYFVEQLFGLTDQERKAIARGFQRYASNADPFTHAQLANAADRLSAARNRR